jgi:hypothetical protein
MKLTSDIITELESIQWFNNCGKKFEKSINFKVKVLGSWDEVIQKYTDPYWEEVSDEEKGILTTHLANKYPQKYHGKWNKLVKEIKQVVEKIIDPQVVDLIQRNNLNPSLLDCVRWDILHALIVIIYERERCRPPVFFKQLYEIYKSGHLPCGWDGEWPEGQLTIY